MDERLANAIYFHLVLNRYVDEDGQITVKYKEDKEAGTLAVPDSDLLKPVVDSVWPLVDSLYMDLPIPTDDRKPKNPAQRGQLRQERVSGLVGTDQSQVRLPGQV